MGEVLLDVRGLFFRYGDRVILGDVTFGVKAGESVAIMGPSGTGKSTLLNLLLGLVPSSGGKVTVAGAEMNGARRAETAKLRRRHIGSVFQTGELLPALTPCENVMVPALLAGVPAPEARRRGRELLDAVGVADSDLSSDRLSGGERQRVALARALVNRPSLIVADEPTGSLDLDSRDEIAEVVFTAPKQWECALVVVTHDPSVAGRASRVGRLDHGALTWE